MPKVLIIEDRRENIVFIANNILRPKGYDVITAMDGRVGLQKAQTEAPDLIITDLKLPGMNGLEVLEQLAENGLNIPSIVMTFHGTEATAVQALRLGARDYLIKPFTMEEMDDALKRAFATPSSSAPGNKDTQARIKSLEAELEFAKAVMTEQEGMLKQLQVQTSEKVSKSVVTRAVKQAEEWEEDNARLNQMLAEVKHQLSKAESRTKALEETIMDQQAQLSKYQKETKRLGDQLRNLSEAMRLMAQDIEHQIGRISIVRPDES
jgi:DNA-binding response OmpR family regulator